MNAWPNNIALISILVLLAMVSFDHSALGKDPPPPGQGHLLLDQWNVPEAEAWAATNLPTNTTNPEQIYFLARLQYYLGQDIEAAELLSKIQESDVSVTPDNLFQLVPFASRRDAQRTEIIGKHFVMRIPKGKSEILPYYALPGLEQILKKLEQELDFKLQERLLVEVLNNLQELSEATGLPLHSIRTSGIIAVCKYNRLLITSPLALVQGYPWLKTAGHELAHAIISKRTRNLTPVWIHEGLAKYVESVVDGKAGQSLAPAAALALANKAKTNQLIPFDSIAPSMAYLPSQEATQLAFAQVFTIIEYLIALDPKNIHRLLTLLDQGVKDRQALKQLTGFNWPVFESKWRRHVLKRSLPDMPRLLRMQRLQYIERGEDAPPEIPEGQEHAHLADLLRERGYFSAAVKEFERASNNRGLLSPAWGVGWARALDQSGKPLPAIDVLNETVRLYPKHVTAWETLAQYQLRASNLGAADKAALKAASINPFNITLHKHWFQIATARKDTQRMKIQKMALKVLRSNSSADSHHNPPPNQP